MAEPTNPRAGGAILALTTMVGAIAGAVMGQGSAGLVGGFVVGAAICLLLWWADRRRS